MPPSAKRHEASPGARLEIEGLTLTHAFRSRPTLRELSLRVDPGERVLLLGPSGCGKTSLALCLNGIIPQSIPASLEGAIELAGRPVGREPPGAWAETIAFVFQDPDSQLCTLTVEDEVAFALENRALPPAEIDAPHRRGARPRRPAPGLATARQPLPLRRGEAEAAARRGLGPGRADLSLRRDDGASRSGIDARGL